MLAGVWPAGDRGSGALDFVVVGGVMLRVLLWWWGGSLSGDEAMLALTIGVRHLRELALPPLYDQSAPLLFLLLTKLITLGVGLGEHSLRFLPLASGCLALLLYAKFANLLGGPRIAIGASLLLAAAAPAVEYSVTFKPYSIDLLVAVLGLYAGYRSLRRPNTRNELALLGLWLVCPWISASSVFVLGGVSLVLVGHRVHRRGFAASLSLMLIACVGLMSFAMAYKWVYSVAAHSDYMRFYWEAAHPHFASRDEVVRSSLILAELAWGIVSRVGIAQFVGPQNAFLPSLLVIGVVVIVLLAGLVGIVRLVSSQGYWVALLVVGPTVGVIAASVVRVYPLAPRLTLCFLPGWLLCIALGADSWLARLAALRLSTSGLGSLISVVMVVCCAGLLVGRGLAQWARLSAARELTHWARTGTGPVYVFMRGIPQYLFYSTDWNRPDLRRIMFVHEQSRAGAPFFENGPSLPPAPEAMLRPLWIGGDSLMLGQPDGLYVRARIGWSGARVDSAWVRTEVERLEAGGRRKVSILALHNVDAGGTRLIETLHRAGWQCHPMFARDGDVAARCSRSDGTPSTPDR
jgi:hypothetical protein